MRKNLGCGPIEPDHKRDNSDYANVYFRSLTGLRKGEEDQDIQSNNDEQDIAYGTHVHQSSSSAEFSHGRCFPSVEP
jgi:hypothetical protein